MDFSVARADVVRAINQRWLLTAWTRGKGAHRIPLWQAVQADDLSRVASHLSILEVEAAPTATRFRILFHGQAIAQAYGSPDCRGKYLDEVVPAGDAKHLAPYRCAVEGRQPVYTVHDLTDRDGRLVRYERLLLPYSRSGESVDHNLAAFEFFCADGAFRHQALMTTLSAPPLLRLSAMIAPHPVPRGRGAGAAL